MKIDYKNQMINYQHYNNLDIPDESYLGNPKYVVSNTQVPWWLRVRYENELNFELESASLRSHYSQHISHGRLRDVELDLTYMVLNDD